MLPSCREQRLRSSWPAVRHFSPFVLERCAVVLDCKMGDGLLNSSQVSFRSEEGTGQCEVPTALNTSLNTNIFEISNALGGVWLARNGYAESTQGWIFGDVLPALTAVAS